MFHEKIATVVCAAEFVVLLVSRVSFPFLPLLVRLIDVAQWLFIIMSH